MCLAALPLLGKTAIGAVPYVTKAAGLGGAAQTSIEAASVANSVYGASKGDSIYHTIKNKIGERSAQNAQQEEAIRQAKIGSVR